MISGKVKAIVRDWFLASYGTIDTILQGEEIGDKKVCLHGRVYGHEDYDPYTGSFQDGHRIITSPVKEVDWGTFLVRTESNSIYQLEGPEGNPSEFFGYGDKY